MVRAVKRSYLSEQIAEEVKKMILDKELKTGDRLPTEKELAEQFQVSRTSVREALRLLYGTGLLTREQDRPVVNEDVSSFFSNLVTSQLVLKSVDNIELMEARELLEVSMVELAAVRRTEVQLKKIYTALERMANNMVPGKKFIDADVKFHYEIAEAANNKVMYYLFQAVRDILYSLQIEVVRSKTIVKTSYEYHHRIYQAIAEKKPEQAAKEMRSHILIVKQTLLELGELNRNDVMVPEP